MVFSLGNFISNQQNTFANVGGCFTCDIQVAAEGQGEFGDTVEILNPTWTMLVNHFTDGGGHGVYQLKNYTPELAKSHDILKTLDDPIGYVQKLTTDVIDPTGVTIN